MLALALALLATNAPAARAAAAPALGATWAGEVVATSARLYSSVTPDSLSTSYRFDYIPSATFEANLGEGKEGFAAAAKAPPGGAAPLGAGATAIEVSQQLSGLSAETAYRYRIVAHNSAGTAISATLGFITQGFGGGSLLLDNRGWEMVSPLDKNGGQVEPTGAGAGVLQAAADGSSVTYSSSASFAAGAAGAPSASQYLSSRTGTGWSSEDIATPLFSGSYGNEPDGAPYRLFSADLARGLLLSGRHCRGGGEGCGVANPPLAGTEAPAGYQDYYLRESAGGGFTALLTAANASLALSPARFGLAFAGASPDLRHVVLSTCAALTAAAIEVPEGEGCDPAEQNLYEWSEGQLRLINLLPGDSQGTPGATLAAQSRAVSTDGSRVYWTDLENGSLYLREGQETKRVDAPGGGGSFQTATPDGSTAFYTEADEHLYRYDAAGVGSSTDLTPSGGVQGVLGASDGGAYVYYLTATGLFLRHGPTTTAVAAAADASNYPPSPGSARVSTDGTRLAFLSTVPLTAYDNTDADSGEPDSEAYLYDATANGGAGALDCVSCNPTEERPIGPSTIPGATLNGQGPRALSADGKRLFFDSRDALVLADTNNAPDAYEWEAQGTGSCTRPGGCLALVSSGKAEGGATFVDASADGSDAFFLTRGSLVSGDPGSVDLYDARPGGGFPEPPTPIPCEGDACQVLPPEPEETTLDTLIAGPGNPPVHYQDHRHRKHRHKRHVKGKRGRR